MVMLFRRCCLQAARVCAAGPRLLVRPRPVWITLGRPMSSVSANDMREGDLLEYENGLWRVTQRQTSRTAQGRAYIQTELRHLTESIKKDVRFRSEDMVERADLETPAKVQVLYVAGDSVAVMDTKTFEQSEIPLAVLGDKAVYLQDGMFLYVEAYNGSPAVVNIPMRATFTITATEETGGGSATLENGLTLRVPKHLKAGDRVIVDTRDGLYVGKDAG